MKINQKIEIEATPERVWEVITGNKYVRQYMFGCEIESEWKEESSLVYYMTKEGKRRDMVSGIIKQLNKPHLLHHTLFPVGAPFPDIPENHISIIYTIEEKGNCSELKIQQSGYEHVAQGKERYEESKGGLKTIATEIKRLAEAK